MIVVLAFATVLMTERATILRTSKHTSANSAMKSEPCRASRSIWLAACLGLLPISSVLFWAASALPLFVKFRFRWVAIFAPIFFVAAFSIDAMVAPVGKQILESPRFHSTGILLSNMPLLYLTKWYNSVVMGHFIVLAALAPVALLLDWCVSRAWRTRALTLIKQVHLATIPATDVPPELISVHDNVDVELMVGRQIIDEVNEIAADVETATRQNIKPAIKTELDSPVLCPQFESKHWVAATNAQRHDNYFTAETLQHFDESLNLLEMHRQQIESSASDQALSRDCFATENYSMTRKDEPVGHGSNMFLPRVKNSKHFVGQKYQVKETIIDIIRFAKRNAVPSGSTRLEQTSNDAPTQMKPAAIANAIGLPLGENSTFANGEALPFLMGYLNGVRKASDQAGER